MSLRAALLAAAGKGAWTGRRGAAEDAGGGVELDLLAAVAARGAGPARGALESEGPEGKGAKETAGIVGATAAGASPAGACGRSPCASPGPATVGPEDDRPHTPHPIPTMATRAATAMAATIGPFCLGTLGASSWEKGLETGRAVLAPARPAIAGMGRACSLPDGDL